MVTTEAGNFRIFFLSIDVSFGGSILLDGH